jgi:MFS family permease
MSASSTPASTSSKQLLPVAGRGRLMKSLDDLNTPVPVISQALEVAPLSMKSVLGSYTLSLAVFVPISGWMADRFGTRRAFASAIGVFTFGSVLCGISSDNHLLVACRVLQGCGGAMMVPVGRHILVRTFANTFLRKSAERTVEATWKRFGPLPQALTRQECANYFRNAGYAST